MATLGLVAYGFVMAAAFAVGGGKVVYKERWGVPLLLAGIAMYAGMWWVV